MKKFLLSLTAAFLITCSSAFATEKNPVPEKIVHTVFQYFSPEGDVQWKETENFYKAGFLAKGEVVEAFVSFEGELIGFSRNIGVNQLPENLVKEVAAKRATATITNLFELTTERGTEYFISYSNGKDIKTYNGKGGKWTRY